MCSWVRFPSGAHGSHELLVREQYMNHTKQFIEDAIEGGWSIQKSYYTKHINFVKLKSSNDFHTVIELDNTTVIENDQGVNEVVPMTTCHHTSTILLDPLAWRAVGKVRGWSEELTYEMYSAFFKALWVGLTIEQALEAISK